ncbi:uncharacterized protein LOC102801321 [Saccoglossus kowalevskii]|uniref:Uncharacterized protein LOC102801321 n=1 Tax=Saccoglossus kowalevskii TaxID=10224 RepID=A0ABM0M6G3_SACKO|nr:PREDICTED: uncharacterized protein LOC102801321 [Saccoglossus kowalevskii]
MESCHYFQYPTVTIEDHCEERSNLEVMFSTIDIPQFRSLTNLMLTEDKHTFLEENDEVPDVLQIPFNRESIFRSDIEELNFTGSPETYVDNCFYDDDEDDGEDSPLKLSHPIEDEGNQSMTEREQFIYNNVVPSILTTRSMAINHMCLIDVTNEDETILEDTFRYCRYPDNESRHRLARITELSFDLVNEWFSCRRAQLHRSRRRLVYPCDRSIPGDTIPCLKRSN